MKSILRLSLAAALTVGGLSLVAPAADALPYCGSYHGDSCNDPGGEHFRCQWTQFEPGICFCNSSGTWSCG